MNHQRGLKLLFVNIFHAFNINRFYAPATLRKHRVSALFMLLHINVQRSKQSTTQRTALSRAIPRAAVADDGADIFTNDGIVFILCHFVKYKSRHESS